MDKTVISGFEMIDKDFGGLKSGEVTLVGGRPGMGKTAFALQIALDAAKKGKSVCFFSAENSPVDLELHLGSIISGIATYKIRNWDMSDKEWNLFKKIMRKVKELPIHFVYTDTIQMMKYWCADENNAVDLIIFDYYQLVKYSFTETKDAAVDLTSVDYLIEFKKLAKKYMVPVIVLSQLNRRIEKRKNKHPSFDDFRIDNLTEEYFDNALLIYRDAYYDLDAPCDKAELIGIYPKKCIKAKQEIKWNNEKCGFEP